MVSSEQLVNFPERREHPIDRVAHHDSVLEATGRIVLGIRPDQLCLPTPCAEWDVRAVLAHLVEANDMFTRAATGREPPSSPDDDPLEAYHRSTAAVGEAWREPGLLERDVTLRFGTVPGRVAVMMHSTDHLVHGWDLAKATGQDTTLDPVLAAAAYEDVTAAVKGSPRPPGGPFGPEVSCRTDAPVHERLVAFLGRQP